MDESNKRWEEQAKYSQERDRSKVLLGQQVRPRDEDVYDEESSELDDDDSTAIEEIGDTPYENQQHQPQPKIATSDLAQLQTGQQEDHSAPAFRPDESNHGILCPDDESILGDSPHNEGHDGEPVP